MVNVTLLGTTVSADDVKVKGSHTEGRWVLPGSKSLSEGTHSDSRPSQTGKGPMMSEAGIKAKKNLGLPEAGRGKKGASGREQKPGFQTFSFQTCERINGCCFKLYDFVVIYYGVLGN